MNAKPTPKTSHTLRQWRTAHEQVSRVSPDRVAVWVEERDWLYTLLDADEGPPIRVVSDHFGYTWIVVTTDPPDVGAVVTDLHAVNVTLSDHGFGPQLLCSLVPFQDPRGTRMALIYLYKRGTFYPFAPQADERRDSVVELQVRDLLRGELPWEADLSRWFPVWDAPGLQDPN